MDSEFSTNFYTCLLSKHSNNGHVMNGVASEKNQFTIDTGGYHLPLAITVVQHRKFIAMLCSKPVAQFPQDD